MEPDKIFFQFYPCETGKPDMCTIVSKFPATKFCLLGGRCVEKQELTNVLNEKYSTSVSEVLQFESDILPVC